MKKVFIASSKEAKKVVRAIRIQLLKEFDSKVEVKEWMWAFELTLVSIEALEKISSETDFAVVVVTADGIKTSRQKKKKAAPRDNVVFELGLFMGCLGRERCFVVEEERRDLERLTDLSGLTVAKFTRPGDQENDEAWERALEIPCFTISQQIKKLPIRNKVGKEALAARADIRSFCDRIEGYWWELINSPGDASEISFFQIEADPLLDSVRMSGKSYNAKGVHVAIWKSVIAS